MNNLYRNLNNSELEQKIKSLAHQERKLTKEIIEHLVEVDRRKLYLDKAYPSLFEYLTKEIKYSAGAAQRRIDAARLSSQFPEITKNIEDGSLNLNHISKVQKIFRQIKNDTGRKVEIRAKREVIQKLINKTSPETDLILAQEFNLEIKTTEKKITQRDESIRVELTFSKKEMETLQSARELLSNSTNGSLKETILKLAETAIKKSGKQPTSTMAVKPTPTIEVKPTSTVAVKPTSTVATSYNQTALNQTLRKSVTPLLRATILNRDQACQFKDTRTNKICGSKMFLEVDHIQPKFAGGNNTPENLRMLCKAHNMYRYTDSR